MLPSTVQRRRAMHTVKWRRLGLSCAYQCVRFISAENPIAAVFEFAAILVFASLSVGAAIAQNDEYDAQIVTGCHFAMGEFGNAGIHMCIDVNRVARKEVEAYPAEYDKYRERCIRRRDLGWEIVKQCLDDDIAAESALKDYPAEHDALIKACTRDYDHRGPARVKLCIDEYIAAKSNCPADEAVAAYMADFEAARISQGMGKGLSLGDAHCAKRKLVRLLPQIMGPVIGYKAAFTNPALRQRFGVSSPDWGAMFGKLMLESGARLPAKFGALPLYEAADFAAVVKDAGLADARTALEALNHLSEIVLFIELPDLMLEGAPTGHGLISINVGFRGGVLGKGVKVEPTQAFLDSLAEMTMVMTEDISGTELGHSPGSAIMDQPINAAIWIARALREEGIELKAGDVLSLGGYILPLPTRPGTRITVRYIGLPGDPSVTVDFE